MQNITAEIEHGFLTLMLRMEMWGRMFVKEHLDHNAEKNGYCWHSDPRTILPFIEPRNRCASTGILVVGPHRRFVAFGPAPIERIVTKYRCIFPKERS